MIPIEKPETFCRIDRNTATYFTTAAQRPMINEYSFKTLPELRHFLSSRLGDVLTEKEILEIAKTAFRNMPRESSEYMELKDREVVDFIYEL